MNNSPDIFYLPSQSIVSKITQIVLCMIFFLALKARLDIDWQIVSTLCIYKLHNSLIQLSGMFEKEEAAD